MKFGALALDYDGTIARDGVLAPGIKPAIAEARSRRIVAIIATGRILSDLRSLCGDLLIAGGLNPSVTARATTTPDASKRRLRLSPALYWCSSKRKFGCPSLM
jgi:hypothetical protein